MEQPLETPYAHFDQPAFQQMQIDHSISRVAIFFICFLTIGVFYFALVAFPISRILPFQQIQQLGSLLNPSAANTRTTVPQASKPAGLGGGSAGASGPASASASASPASAAPASAAAGSSGAVAASARPSTSAVARAGTTYVVQSGDTLTSIARRYNTTTQALASANKIAETGTIQIGQRLTIP